MPKDPLIEAEKKLSKAELFSNADQYKKAGKLGTKILFSGLGGDEGITNNEHLLYKFNNIF